MLPEGPNLYAYVGNDPVNFYDYLGLDTYTINRTIGGGPAKPRKFRYSYSHTFTCTTNPDGTVKNTYSWGNKVNTHGWSKNQSEDISAASEALRKGYAKKEGGSSLDPAVDKAFDDLNKKKNEHCNLGVCRNCKAETQKLLKKAKEIQKAH